MSDDTKCKIIIGLAALAVVLAGYCVMQKKEFFDYSKESAVKLCKLQSGYIGYDPFIGSQKNQKIAYNKCLSSWTPPMNMPSAYVPQRY